MSYISTLDSSFAKQIILKINIYIHGPISLPEMQQKENVVLYHYYFLSVIHFYDSVADLLLEFIHGLCDALLPWLLVFLQHGRLQVLLQLLIQLGDREST